MFHEILQRYCENLEKSYDWYSVTETQQEEIAEGSHAGCRIVYAE